jgi:hypothetical protein
MSRDVVGKTHVTNIAIKESSIHAVLQFSNSYQRDKQLLANQSIYNGPGKFTFQGPFLYVLIH